MWFTPLFLLAQDANTARIVFIADASNTMEKVIQREAKMDIVQDVLHEWRQYVPAEQPVGLVAYGHRSQFDCDDIELLVPIHSIDVKTFCEEIEGLTPYGRTPLANSVAFVLDEIRYTEGHTTIILLTDGIETCGGNLCEVVETGLDDGLDFSLHIVGFDLKKKDRSNLECAAQASNGLYVDAENRNELTAALSLTRSLATSGN